jgi:hypothetical protein
MNRRQPSPLALAFFDCFVAGNEPLKGDLLEEFDARQSQWWLWRQVIGAVVCQRKVCILQRERTDMLVLGAAVLVLLSFEAVFITNLLHHLMFGPPIPSHEGYMVWTSRLEVSASQATPMTRASIYAPLAALTTSIPIAWLISRFHERHYALSRGIFSFSVMVCTGLSLELPFEIQFLTTLVFVVGLLMSGCVAAATHQPSPAPWPR